MVKGISSSSSILPVRIQWYIRLKYVGGIVAPTCRTFVEHSTLSYSLLYLFMFLCTRVFPFLAHIRFLCFACMIEGVGLNPCSIEKSFRNNGRCNEFWSFIWHIFFKQPLSIVLELLTTLCAPKIYFEDSKIYQSHSYLRDIVQPF